VTEDDARTWIADGFGEPALAAMERLVDLISAEAGEQNLVAPSTLPTIWARHIVDSAQLLGYATAADENGLWLDIGSGAGFPGLVIAALTLRPVILVEPRKRRAEFLQRAAEVLDLGDRVTVRCAQVQAVAVPASVISARAVATLGNLFDWASGCASSPTRWILPKGRSARDEVAVARQAWHGVFHVEHSITDPESLIVLASGVARR
jgi:16S rRNA (guanine527-N7)-methyltransferase